MLVYHGSHIVVKNPQLSFSEKFGDFGTGFYTTTSLEQAKRWSQIRARREKIPQGIVTVFMVPDSLFELKGLKIHRFLTADDAWLDFVLENRQKMIGHSYDLVVGPVADDRVYTCLNALENGFSDRQTVIAQLKTYLLADQILFRTAKSLLLLNYQKMIEVPCSLK